MRKIILMLLMFSSLVLWAQEKPVITVLDLETSDVSAEDMKLIVSGLMAELFNTGLYTVIDTSTRDKLLSEQAFSLTGAVDEESMLKIGELLSAKELVIGSVRKRNGSYFLSCKIVETETGKTLDALEEKYASIDSLLKDLHYYTKRLSDKEAELPPVIFRVMLACDGSLPVFDMSGISTAGAGAMLRFSVSFLPVHWLIFGLESGYRYYFPSSAAVQWLMEVPVGMLVQIQIPVSDAMSFYPAIGGGVSVLVLSYDEDGIILPEPYFVQNIALEPNAKAGVMMDFHFAENQSLTLNCFYNLILEQTNFMHYINIQAGITFKF